MTDLNVLSPVLIGVSSQPCASYSTTLIWNALEMQKNMNYRLNIHTMNTLFLQLIGTVAILCWPVWQSCFYFENRQRNLISSRQIPSHLRYLHTPVEQVLGADIVLVLFDIVEQAAVGHQLRDELHRWRQADAEQATHMRVFHAGHHVSLLWCTQSFSYHLEQTD